MKLVLTFDMIVQAIREYIIHHNMIPQGQQHAMTNVTWTFNIGIAGVHVEVIPMQPGQSPPAQTTHGMTIQMTDPNKKKPGSEDPN